MKKHLVYRGLTVAVLPILLIASSIQAGITTDTISIKFGANQPSPGGSALDPPAIAGVPGVESANWNNASFQGGTLNDLVRDTFGEQTTTTAGVTFNATNTTSSGTNNHFTGDNKTLMTGYLDQDSAPVLISVYIFNLPDDLAEGYDVYVYFLGNTSHRGGVYTVSGVAKFGFITDDVRGPDFKDAEENVPPAAGNYLVFRGLSGTEIRITADNDIGNRAPINAVEIVRRPAK